MNTVNSLESVFYISMPENFKLSDESFQIDTSIQLPVQKKDSDEYDLYGEFTE